jgi:hypothetical protein
MKKMKNDLHIVAKGPKSKAIKVIEEIEKEVKAISGKDYAVKQITTVPDEKKRLPKGDDNIGTTL